MSQRLRPAREAHGSYGSPNPLPDGEGTGRPKSPSPQIPKIPKPLPDCCLLIADR